MNKLLNHLRKKWISQGLFFSQCNNGVRELHVVN